MTRSADAGPKRSANWPAMRWITPKAVTATGPRHSLVVATSYEALATGVGSADIQGHGPITAAAARRLACEYGIIPAVLGTESRILDLGVPNRLATPEQRFHLALRDGGCLFPGCDRPAAADRCAPSHPSIDGGPTAEHNLDSLCVFHHVQVHEGGWTYRIIDNETLEFFPPGGGPPIISKRKPFFQPDLYQTAPPRTHRPHPKHPAEHRRIGDRHPLGGASSTGRLMWSRGLGAGLRHRRDDGRADGIR